MVPREASARKLLAERRHGKGDSYNPKIDWSQSIRKLERAKDSGDGKRQKAVGMPGDSNHHYHGMFGLGGRNYLRPRSGEDVEKLWKKRAPISATMNQGSSLKTREPHPLGKKRKE